MLDTNVNDILTKSATGILTLSGIKGFGRVAVEKIVHEFDTLGAFLSAPDSSLKALLNSRQREMLADPKVFDAAHKQAVKEMSRAAQIDALVISKFDEDYPASLAAMHDAPLVLYVSGDISALRRTSAFVGTTDATDFGRKVAHAMAEAAAKDGITVVSGLTGGIDAAALAGALDAGTPACAVLGTGLDFYTTQAAMNLAEKICLSGGLIVTAQSFGSDADTGSYILRDKIIAALADAVFFIQGSGRSPSMNVVRYAVSRNVPVYVPGIPERFRSETENHTALELSRLTLSQASTKYGWNGEVLAAVERSPDARVAVAVNGREDYPSLFPSIGAQAPHAPAFDIAATF